MGALLLYVVVAVAILLLVDRWVVTVSLRAAIIIFLLPLLLTGRALFTGRVYAPVDLAIAHEPFASVYQQLGIGQIRTGALGDIYSQIIPWHQAVRSSIAAGEWPVWNPYILAGDILAASAQPAPYYPFLLLSLLLPADLALTFLASIFFFVSALGAFLFIRELDCSEEAALVGAAAWAFSAEMVFWCEWPLGTACSFLPWVLLGTSQVVHRRDFPSVILLAICLAMLVLAGHPETALHVVALGVVFGLLELFSIRRPMIPGALRAAVLAGVIALGVTAVFILPITEALPQTHEHTVRQVLGRGVTLSLPWKTALRHTLKNVVPFDRGLPQDPQIPWSPEELARAYPGSIALALAAVGVLARKRQRWLMATFIVFGIFAGANAPFPIRALEALPFFRLTLNDRFIIAASIGMAVLAAFGAEELLSRARRTGVALFLFIGVMTAVAVMAIWPDVAGALTKENLLRHPFYLFIPLVLAILAVSLASRPAVVPFMFLLLIAQRSAEEQGIYPTLPRRAFYPAVAELQALPREGPPFRFVSQFATFTPNISTMYSLEDVRGYQAMTHARRRETYSFWCTEQPAYYNRVDDLTRPFLSFLNVRFALTPLDQPVPEGWRPVSEGPAMRLIENLRVLPRAFVPRFVRLGSEPHDLIDMAGQRDFGERVWIAARRKSQPGETRDIENGNGSVEIRSRGHARYELRSKMRDAGWVVISETAWKGWQARIDGSATSVFIANHAFLGIHVPAGEHTIELVYRPQGFVRGLGISIGTLIALAAAVVFRSWKRREARTIASATVN